MKVSILPQSLLRQTWREVGEAHEEEEVVAVVEEEREDENEKEEQQVEEVEAVGGSGKGRAIPRRGLIF